MILTDSDELLKTAIESLNRAAEAMNKINLRVRQRDDAQAVSLNIRLTLETLELINRRADALAAQ